MTMQPIVKLTIKCCVVLELDGIMKVIDLKIQVHAAIAIIAFLSVAHIRASFELLRIHSTQIIHLFIVSA